MYFDAGVKAGNYIYLIEHISRCLISIDVFSGETNIETYLPWRYKENKIGMLLLNQNIFIYSPVVDCFLIYDCLKKQILTIELQDIKADETGIYFSNVLMERDGFIVLPFKDEEIKRYKTNGEVKFKDSQWYFAVTRICGGNKHLLGNIRMDSACIAGNQLFFSFVYGKQNYLCRYELEQEEHLCGIVYNSGEIPIRGIYSYSNIILFRRIFPDKTEIVLLMLDSDEQKSMIINYPATFTEDIFGNIHHLCGSFKNKILALEGNNLRAVQNIYNFEPSDVYIANGILFNRLKNEIIISDMDHVRRYSIEKIVMNIKQSSFYQDGYINLFGSKCIEEGKYIINDLIKDFTGFLSLNIEKKCFIKNKNNGTYVWNAVR